MTDDEYKEQMLALFDEAKTDQERLRIIFRSLLGLHVLVMNGLYVRQETEEKK